jgi:hypothetical protein
MIALLGALAGFVSSAAPELLKLAEDRGDRAHEIALLRLQMEYDEKKLAAQQAQGEAQQEQRLQEIRLATAAKEEALLNVRTGIRTGIFWVDALAGSVRPLLTYAFFLLYFAVKCAQFHLLLTPNLPWLAANPAQALITLWTGEDIAFFSAVIGFWLGNRTLEKTRR